MDVRRTLRRLLRRETFVPGDRVTFIEDDTAGVVRQPGRDYSVVVWDDAPNEGGSRVPNAKLRRSAD